MLQELQKGQIALTDPTSEAMTALAPIDSIAETCQLLSTNEYEQGGAVCLLTGRLSTTGTETLANDY